MPRSQGTSRKGKPKKNDRAAGMGRALQKAQYKKFKPRATTGGMAASGATSIGMEHEQEPSQGEKIRSVLETNDLTDFITRAEMADREFEVEKEQFIVLDQNANEVKAATNDSSGKLGAVVEEEDKFEFAELAVPRRPQWDESTTPEELDMNERNSFLEWRRAIAKREESVYNAANSSGGGSGGGMSRITSTPFEKNLEVWRQLWRVLERADSVAMVVDGRNPLFYLSTDLRTYVEDDLGKKLIMIVNKCDYLTEGQRQIWHEYFVKMELEHVFFSAYLEQEVLDDAFDRAGDDDHALTILEDANENKESSKEKIGGENEAQNNNTGNKQEEGKGNQNKWFLHPDSIGIKTPLKRVQLLEILCNYARISGNKTEDESIEFGMVGFPNVGKSSVLNVLVGASKRDHQTNRVGVASQPGKTKHFQTLHVPDRKDVVLCDCPGLVFPSFVSSAGDLIVAGVFPLNQVRDFWPAVELIARRIPREILEAFYGLELPRLSALDAASAADGHKNAQLAPPTARELLKTYCIARSMLAASSGEPDYHQAARVIMKDYVTGKLLFCHSPPLPEGMDEKKWDVRFRQETFATALMRTTKLREKLSAKVVKQEAAQANQVNEAHHNDTSDLTGLEDDMDMFDLIEGSTDVTNPNSGSSGGGGKRGKKHKSMQKWGKKGRKTRNKDPYGCHTEPDEELLGRSSGSGLVVNAGKYGSKSYTRPNYSGAKSATVFTTER